jgi:hypothetical protein
VALERVLRQISETLKPTYEALRIVSADKNSYGADQRGH